MRAFAVTENFASLIFLMLYLPTLAMSIIPGVFCIYWSFEITENSSIMIRVVASSLALSLAYFFHQFSLPLLCGLMYRILPIRYPVGSYPLHSWNGVKWAACTTLHRVARQHFPTYSLPSWYANLYYRLMGANIGKGAHIATLLINDPLHVSIGDGAVVGGGAIINSHSVEGTELIVAKNVIGNNATIGLNSVLLAGVCVGESAIVGARSVVVKHRTIPAGEKWIGSPAKKI